MKKKMKTLSDSQSSALVEGTWGRWGERDRQIVTHILHTGLKIREFVGLNVEDVYSGKRVRNNIMVRSESDLPDRKIPMNREAREAIAIMLDFNRRQGFSLEPGEPLVISRQRNRKDGSHRITPRQVQRILKSLSKDASIEFKTTPQTLRHTYAAEQLRQGKNLEEVRKLLGHRSIKTTRDLYGADLPAEQ